MDKYKHTLLFYLAILIIIIVFIFGYWLPMMEAKEGEIEALKQEKESLLDQNIELKQIRDELQEIQHMYQELKEIKDLLSGAREMEATITAYAPLDPRAVEGMCYSGDPSITASGATVVPGLTVAAGPGVPFGTKVLIEDYGIWEVQDRGGSIKNNNFDLAVETREEALAIGRKKVKVLIIES